MSDMQSYHSIACYLLLISPSVASDEKKTPTGSFPGARFAERHVFPRGEPYLISSPSCVRTFFSLSGRSAYFTPGGTCRVMFRVSTLSVVLTGRRRIDRLPLSFAPLSGSFSPSISPSVLSFTLSFFSSLFCFPLPISCLSLSLSHCLWSAPGFLSVLR